VDIVPRGWEEPSWLRSFYPADLPPEWRLAYFANELPAVLVPAEVWLAADDALGGLAADVPPGFRFYLELPPSGWAARPWAPVAACLGARLAGLVAVQVPPDPSDASAEVPRYLLAEQPQPGWAPARLAPPPGPGGLRAQRAWLEATARQAPGRTSLIVVEGAASTPEALRGWWDLAYLLGLA